MQLEAVTPCQGVTGHIVVYSGQCAPASSCCSHIYLLLDSVSQACMYRSLPGQQQAQRCADFVSLVFSSAACSAAGWQLLSYAWEGSDASQHAMERATKMVCIAAGFFAFRLWTLVHRCESSAVIMGTFALS